MTPRLKTTQRRQTKANVKAKTKKPIQKPKQPSANYDGMINEFRHVEPTSEIIALAIKKLKPRDIIEPSFFISLIITVALTVACFYSKKTIHIMNIASSIAVITLITQHIVTQLYYLNISKTLTADMLKQFAQAKQSRAKSRLKKQMLNLESSLCLQAITLFISAIIAVSTIYEPYLDLKTEHTIAVLSTAYIYPALQTILDFKNVIKSEIGWQNLIVLSRYTDLKNNRKP